MLISLLMNLGMFGTDTVIGGKGDNSEDSGVSSSKKSRRRQIIKPTGLIDRPRIERSVEALVEQSAEIAREVSVAAEREFSVPEIIPISRMKLSEIDAEIGRLLQKKLRDDEDEFVLLMLMIASE